MLTRCFVLAGTTLLGLMILPHAADSQMVTAGQGERCGPMDNTVCEYGLWCEFDAGSCDSSSPAGSCVEIPKECRYGRARKVCGCDGRAYGGDCERRQARVQKLQDGPCGQDSGR
jgi:hypothetical protein